MNQEKYACGQSVSGPTSFDESVYANAGVDIREYMDVYTGSRYDIRKTTH